MIRVSPVHLSYRPCSVLARDGGGAASGMPGAVTCAECVPAAEVLAVAVDRLVAVAACAVGAVLLVLACCLG